MTGISDPSQHFRWELEDSVGHIVLDRPEKKNPLTFESYAHLRDLLREAVDASALKAIIISGAGGNFCSGGDVHEIIGPLTSMEKPELLEFTQLTGDLVKAMRAAPQPIIAAVDGVCAGAGAILAMASDLRLATPGAKTAFLFNRVGLAGCDMGACAILPRIVGHGRASELLLTGRSFSAEEGERWGFYNRIVAADDLLSEAMALAGKLAKGPNLATAMTKRQLDAEWDMGIEAAIDAEAEAQAECMTTNDFKRAYAAFANKEKPEFKGD